MAKNKKEFISHHRTDSRPVSPSSMDIISSEDSASLEETTDVNRNFHDKSLAQISEEPSRMARLGSCKEHSGSADGSGCPVIHEKSLGKGMLSSSSRDEIDKLQRGRSKREIKRTSRFHEMTFPMKSAKKLRRVKIMRFLGLAAPVGSPFQLQVTDS